MKKYVKPEVIFESCELSSQVAACRWDLNTLDKNACEAGLDYDLDNDTEADYSMSLFTETPRCTTTDIGSYCYMTGSGDGCEKVFRS